MALDANTVWEVRTDGDDDNGGGFVTGASGTDYSQQASAQLTLSDLACTTGGTTLTSATGGFTAAMIGNLIQIKSGTNFTAGWYQITAHTDTNTVTLDRDPTNGSNASSGTGSVGGALASPGQFGKAFNDHGVGGMKAWIKSGTYTLNTASANVAGGPVDLTSAPEVYVEGYSATREDLGTKPVINAGTETSLTVVALDGAHNKAKYVVNLEVDGNSQTGITGFSGGGAIYTHFFMCRAANCDTYGFSSGRYCVHCIADGCGVGFSSCTCVLCRAKDCDSHGFTGSTRQYVQCIADGCGGRGFSAGYDTAMAGCVAYGNTDDGFRATYGSRMISCLSYGNGGYGFESDSHNNFLLALCASGNNTAGHRNSIGDNQVYGFSELAADPFVDAANGDFNINDTAGGGADLRAVEVTL